MTFSGELAVFLALCVIGLTTSCGTLRYSWLNYAAVKQLTDNQEVIDGAGHFRTHAIEKATGWFGFLMFGLVATIPTPPPEPIGVTPIGLVLRYLFLFVIAIWSFMTASDFVYGRRQWGKHRSAERASD